MGFYKHLAQAWKHPDPTLMRERMTKWRKENAVTKIERPTNLSSARTQGYRAKKGFIIARVRVQRGGRMRPQLKKGRRPTTQRRRKIVNKSYQTIAEERANRKFHNCEVLNSYKIAQDGKQYWFEVILVDPHSPSIKRDKNINWIMKNQHHGRVFRGITSSARKSRGLRHKGKGTEKIRPSLRANKRKAH
jgi:large subunit ribosomal protein L15e